MTVVKAVVLGLLVAVVVVVVLSRVSLENGAAAKVLGASSCSRIHLLYAV